MPGIGSVDARIVFLGGYCEGKDFLFTKRRKRTLVARKEAEKHRNLPI
jgi:hypothetical protein